MASLGINTSFPMMHHTSSSSSSSPPSHHHHHHHHSSSNNNSNSNPRQEEFGLYEQALLSAASSSGPMDMNIANDTYMFPTSMPLDHSSPTFAEAANYTFGGRLSPPSALEDSDLKIPPSNLSSASAHSASSSAVGSPQSHHGQPGNVPDWAAAQGLGLTPSIVPNDFYGMSTTEYTSFAGPGMEDFSFDYTAATAVNTKAPGFVDPSLIHPEITRGMPMPPFEGVFQQQHGIFPTSPSAISPSPQPAARNGSHSPYIHHDGFAHHQTQQHQPQPHQYAQPFSPFQSTAMNGRRPSVQSYPSTFSDGNAYSGDETKEKPRCPHPDCGRTFKDLKAHMLTHQNERPEKCPIQTCDYHIKGFARKYDKNRHTLTHYKGTMVCGFCPGSGSPAEKSFNRADVFKRHLTAVHGVEQTPPNSRKKAGAANNGKKLTGYAPDATGKCSTCSQTFSNAQDFYEHLDDCVLRIVQQEDPAEAVNARLLGEMENDKDVVRTLQRNSLPTQTQPATMADEMEEDSDSESDEGDDDNNSSNKSGSSPARKKNKTSASGSGISKSKGMTHSRGGVAARTKAKGRKSKHKKPKSWGIDKGYVNMKKRVMCAFDGPRRLAKDDLMLSTEHEVRVKLSDGNSYTTDLDILTLQRAEGFHSATEEEKGLWVSDDPTEAQFRQMQEYHDAMQQQQQQQQPVDQVQDMPEMQFLDCTSNNIA